MTFKNDNYILDMAYGLQGSIRRSRGVIRHPYCRVFQLKKLKKRKIRIFAKPDFPVQIRIRWYGNIRGVTLRSQEVRRSEKSEKKFPENPDFPDPDPYFRISSYGVANGAERATCSQNFRPLGAIVSKCLRHITIIKYRIFPLKFSFSNSSSTLQIESVRKTKKPGPFLQEEKIMWWRLFVTTSW